METCVTAEVDPRCQSDTAGAQNFFSKLNSSNLKQAMLKVSDIFARLDRLRYAAGASNDPTWAQNLQEVLDKHLLTKH